MQAKSFLFMSVVVIVAVAVITSLIGVMMFQQPVLLADTGTIQVQGITSGGLNVILVVAGTTITKDMIFTGVSQGTDRQSTVPDISGFSCPAPGPCPEPFLIRNEGDAMADVEIDRSNLNFFDPDTEEVTSFLRIWVDAPDPSDAVGSGINPYTGDWSTASGFVDQCLSGPGGTINDCFTSGLCQSNFGAPTLMCDIPRSGSPRRKIIDNLVKDNANDEAILHAWIRVANDESGVTKSTTVNIVGVAAA